MRSTSAPRPASAPPRRTCTDERGGAGAAAPAPFRLPMSEGFDPHNPPFDRLTQQEIEEVRAALDIGYFAPGEVIIAAGRPAEALHVVIKGAVEVRMDGALEAVLGPHDSFDSRALVHGAAGEEFRATEETLCFLLPGEVVRRLIARNLGFAAFFYSEISRKLDAYADAHRTDGVESVLRARCATRREAGPWSSTARPPWRRRGG